MQALCILTLYFLVDVTIFQFLAISAVGMFGYAFFNLVIWAFVNDVSDYHELVSGLREDGTVYSIYSMARKIGQAIAGGVGGIAISAVGYDSTAKIQESSVLEGIYSLATLVPAIFYFVIVFILILFYPLNKKKTLQLKVDLNQKRLESKENMTK